ncbi:YIP1 family protein [Marinilabilia rubra]|uniref:Yip1 domain-containing protein n=1 Tax=Marinilabilia rubra TaxID=2162893 RepID=A0A2U2B9R1_9BACT|nr:YIP1 family protein [Marinilabilia rubra]PWD99782.1 hypothetical protein DDZ16_07760 [Marinilabilia rubra]
MSTKKPENTGELYRNLVVRLRNFVISPVLEWRSIHRESTTFNDMLGNFALPLVGLVTIATFVSHLINQQAFILELAMKKAILVFVALLGAVFLSWYIVAKLLKFFQFVVSGELAAKLVIYSSGPLYVISFVTALIPEIFFIYILAFYSFYLAWLGVRDIAGPVHHRKFVFSVVVGVLVMGIPFLIKILLLNLLTI